MIRQHVDDFFYEQENALDSSDLMGEAILPSHWKWAKMGEIGSISGGGTPSTNVPMYWNGNIPWLTPSEVTHCGYTVISRTERNISNAGLAASASKLLSIGTVMMTSRATIGEAVINIVPMTTNQGFINIFCNKSDINNLFLVYWIKHHKRMLEDRASGATFKELSKSNFKTIPILLPPLPEQRAIARVLQTTQNAIQARYKELALERERKAALMQHLFTDGTRGEATKQTEIGEIPESWSVLKLGDVITLQRGFDLPSSRREVGNVPIISSSGISGTHSCAKVTSPGVVTGRYGTIGQVFYVETDFWPLNTTLFVSDFKKNNPRFVSYFLQCIDLQALNDKTSVPG
ncbi:MAG: restriction endonuclease subunit S, partial [Ktedonobacteraceae bacterium]